MKKTNCLFTLWVAALCAGTHAYAVGTAPAILSNYGEIQSVKNYSSNPFWNKNSPYNQNFPKPIYATGADLNTGDCNRVVENLVTSYCAEHNYCRNLRISDVRPTIMVQLSQLPGHNFATSCGGYIDSAFDKFQKEYGNVSTVNLSKPASQPANIEIANPFAPKQTAAQKAVADRTAELEKLQSITTPTAGVHAEYFPKTTADLSFTDRLANTAAGYEPYKDLESYKKPDFLGEDEEFFNRLRAQNFEKFCERRPDDAECKKWYCEQNPDDEKCKKTTPAQQTDPTPPVNPPITPPNTNCPDTHMTINPTTGKCECTGKYAPKPGAPNTCICADPNLDITTNDACDSTPPPISGPQCLIDIANDANFKSAMSSKLTGVTDLNKWINNNKTDFYTLVADYVVQHCLKSTSDKITEFNLFLDTNAPLPISIDFNGNPTTVSFDKMELFDYVTYWSYPIVIHNSGVKDVGTVLPESVVHLPAQSNKCTGNHYLTSRAFRLSYILGTTGLEAGARPTYPNNPGKEFVLGNIHFPGMLYCINWEFKWKQIGTKNYALARDQVKRFVDGVNNDGRCAGNSMMIYLVSEPSSDYSNVKIMSEPFVIR